MTVKYYYADCKRGYNCDSQFLVAIVISLSIINKQDRNEAFQSWFTQRRYGTVISFQNQRWGFIELLISSLTALHAFRLVSSKKAHAFVFPHTATILDATKPLTTDRVNQAHCVNHEINITVATRCRRCISSSRPKGCVWEFEQQL